MFVLSAVKCNNDEVILQTLVNLDTGFDCASLAEIQQIVQMHVQPNRIIFANPCKPISHIIYAKQQQVAIMTVDNEEEINKIAKYFPEAKYFFYYILNLIYRNVVQLYLFTSV